MGDVKGSLRWSHIVNIQTSDQIRGLRDQMKMNIKDCSKSLPLSLFGLNDQCGKQSLSGGEGSGISAGVKVFHALWFCGFYHNWCYLVCYIQLGGI